ncbi:MAG TPA: hemerythrin domain-containing protein [Actinocrinis sp.]|nr:hemerythrin domain-containing protein [Actinocrinis sp.]
MDMAQREREVAAELPAGSVLAVLYEQHAKIRDLFKLVNDSHGDARQVAFDQLRQLLAEHEAAEEMVVRPISKKAAGAQVADARNAEESEAAHALAELEKLDVNSPAFEAKFELFEAAVSEHASREDNEEFPHLMAKVGVEEQQEMGKLLQTAQKIAPSHPHPGAAGSTTAQYALGPFAALLDKAKDAYASVKNK